MKVETIVTLEGTDRYYLADETIYNDIKYFMATKLGKDDKPTNQTVIFEEIYNEENNEYYLDEVKDEKTTSFLATVFISNLISEVDEKIED